MTKTLVMTRGASINVDEALTPPSTSKIVDLHSLLPSSTRLEPNTKESNNQTQGDANNPVSVLTPDDTKGTAESKVIKYPPWHPAKFENNFELYEQVQKSKKPAYSEPPYDPSTEVNEIYRAVYQNLSESNLDLE